MVVVVGGGVVAIVVATVAVAVAEAASADGTETVGVVRLVGPPPTTPIRTI
jgi:hypothetical protein